MIITTRYRDIPWEEARKCSHVINDAKAGKAWEARFRGKPVDIAVPAIQTPLGAPMICGGPFFLRQSADNSANIVCPHIAEIGD